MVAKCNVIEIYNDFNDTILNHKVIAVEMHGVSEYEDNGLMFVKQDNENPEYYSVYVRQEEGTISDPFNPLICIADFADKEHAEDFANFIRKLLKLSTDDSGVR